MKNKDKLLQKIALYSATAVAATGAGTTYALDQLNPVTGANLTSSGTVAIDFDDGGADPEFEITLDLGTPSIVLADNTAGSDIGLSFLGTRYSPGTTLYSVQRLDAGDTIGPMQTNWQNYFNGYAYIGEDQNITNFVGMDGYIGVRFNLGADLHYGWIYVTGVSGAPNENESINVVNYAYNPTPNEAIAANFIGDATAVDLQSTAANSDAPNRFTVVWATAAAALSAATLWVRRHIWGQQN